MVGEKMGLRGRSWEMVIILLFWKKFQINLLILENNYNFNI